MDSDQSFLQSSWLGRLASCFLHRGVECWQKHGQQRGSEISGVTESREAGEVGRSQGGGCFTREDRLRGRGGGGGGDRNEVRKEARERRRNERETNRERERRDRRKLEGQ